VKARNEAQPDKRGKICRRIAAITGDLQSCDLQKAEGGAQRAIDVFFHRAGRRGLDMLEGVGRRARQSTLTKRRPFCFELVKRKTGQRRFPEAQPARRLAQVSVATARIGRFKERARSFQ
jgi:hypothetical protein